VDHTDGKMSSLKDSSSTRCTKKKLNFSISNILNKNNINNNNDENDDEDNDVYDDKGGGSDVENSEDEVKVITLYSEIGLFYFIF